MRTYRFKQVFPVLMLSAVLLVGLPSWALAQCSGGDHSSMHQQQSSSDHSGHMISGHAGMHGNQSAVQSTPNTVVTPAPGYVDPQNTGGYGSSGQMMGQGGATSDHSGHTGQ